MSFFECNAEVDDKIRTPFFTSDLIFGSKLSSAVIFNPSASPTRNFKLPTPDASIAVNVDTARDSLARTPLPTTAFGSPIEIEMSPHAESKSAAPVAASSRLRRRGESGRTRELESGIAVGFI